MMHAHSVFVGRLGRLAGLVALSCFAGAAWGVARAEEPAVLASGELLPASWEEDSAADRAAAADAIPMSLSARVAELEKQIRDMQTLQTAAAEEPLPGMAEAAKEECKEVEIIVKPTFTPTGRIYFDGVNYDDDPATTTFFNTDRENEFGLRTFRIGAKGNIYENLIYSLEVELRGGPNSITYKDIYIEQQNLPGIGHFRAGHFKEPIGLEEFGSDLFNTFMEKTPATNSFAPGRNFGVMMWDNCDPCWDSTWFLGLFRADSPDAPNNSGLWKSDNNDWCIDARYAFLPFYDEPSKGRYLMHVGGSYSYRRVGALTTGATANQNTAYSTLNGLAEFTTKSWVGTQAPIGFGSEADTNQWNQLNGEYALIWGATSFQAEYFQLLMNGGEHYQGGYAFLSYFLTGESRGYKKENKTIDRVIPYEPFFWVDTCNGGGCGRGAWELAMGYSWVDLEDGSDIVSTVPANSTNRLRGFNNNFILGVNWYHNPWSRVSIDYERELVNYVDSGVPNSDANIWGMRWQVDW